MGPARTLAGCLLACTAACVCGVVADSAGVAFVCVMANGFGYALHIAAVEDVRRGR